MSSRISNKCIFKELLKRAKQSKRDRTKDINPPVSIEVDEDVETADLRGQKGVFVSLATFQNYQNILDESERKLCFWYDKVEKAKHTKQTIIHEGDVFILERDPYT